MKTLKLKNVGTALSIILTHAIGSDLQSARHLLGTNPGVISARRKA
jgi:hypothetical protein